MPKLPPLRGNTQPIRPHDGVVPPPPEPPKLEDGTELGIDCPECGRPMKVRTNGDNGSRFAGCSGYPACRHTADIPTFHKMRALGAPTLPGFDL